MTRFLSLIALSLMLYGCEGSTEYYTEIHNLSSHRLNISYLPQYSSGIDSLILERGQIDKKLQFNKFGGIATIQSCNIWFGDALIVNQNGDTCKADFQDENRWSNYTIRTAKMPGSYEHTCRLIITDSDF